MREYTQPNWSSTHARYLTSLETIVLYIPHIKAERAVSNVPLRQPGNMFTKRKATSLNSRIMLVCLNRFLCVSRPTVFMGQARMIVYIIKAGVRGAYFTPYTNHIYLILATFPKQRIHFKTHFSPSMHPLDSSHLQYENKTFNYLRPVMIFQHGEKYWFHYFCQSHLAILFWKGQSFFFADFPISQQSFWHVIAFQLMTCIMSTFL